MLRLTQFPFFKGLMHTMKSIFVFISLFLCFYILSAQDNRWQKAADDFLKTQMQQDDLFEGYDRLRELFDILSLNEQQSNDPHLSYLRAVWAAEFAEETESLTSLLMRFESDSVRSAVALMDYATSHGDRYSERDTVLLVYMEKALALFEDAKLDSSYLFIQSLMDYASMLNQKHQVHDRLRILNRALLLAESKLGVEHPLYADLLEAIAGHYISIGELELSVRFKERADQNRRNFLGVNQPYRLLFERKEKSPVEILHEVQEADIIRKAWLYQYSNWLGDQYANRVSPYRKWLASNLYTDWINHTSDVKGAYALSDIKVLIHKGQLEMDNANYKEAIQTFRSSKQRIENLLKSTSDTDNQIAYYNTLNLLGCAYYADSNYTEAAQWFEQLQNHFLKSRFSAYEWTVKVSHNRILALSKSSDPSRVKEILKQFVEKPKGINIDFDWRERTELYGDMMFRLKEYKSALVLYTDVYKHEWQEGYESRTQQKEELAEIEIIQTYGDENMVLDIGSEAAVMMMYDDTFKPYGPDYRKLLRKLSATSILAGHPQQAIQHSGEYINEYYHERESVALFQELGGKTDLLDIYEQKEALFPVYDWFLEGILSDTLSEQDITIDNKKRAFAHVLDAKVNLLYQYRHMRKALESSKDESLKKSYEQFKELQQQYARQKSANASQEELEQLKIELDTLRASLSYKTALVAAPSEKFVFWQQVKEKLKQREAVVEIKRFKALANDQVVYAAFIIKPDSEYPEIIFLQNGEFLEGRGLKKYQNSIQARIEDRISYYDYWKPIQEYLKGVRKVFLSPDGVYAQINVHALFNPDKGNYLIDDLTVYQIVSAKELPSATNIRRKVKKATLMGRPAYYINDYNKQEVFDNAETDPERAITHAQIASGNVSDLPGTEKEVESVAKSLKKNRVAVDQYLGAEATEEAFKKSKPDILHVATHGFWFKEHEAARADAMFNSGLLFAGVMNQQAQGVTDSNDGILTAYEVQGMNLEGTQLAVLSACETALGHVEVGEGVFGLQRAFKIAGVEKLMMSLWKVDDEATRLLFESFYKNWMTGNRSIEEAFQLAQQEIKKVYKDPYYWGAFVLVN